VNEANLAVERLAELGLTGPAKTGSVIYYDIEHYGTNSGCRTAVNAFMNGWVSQIRARGSLAGVYASTLCNTGLSDFLTITNVPDVIWPARWYHNLGSGFYDPSANVWNLGSCVLNTAWANHQRIRQYEGDHNETWGGLTLDIDSDALDGVVAIPYDYPYVSRTSPVNPNPTASSTVDFTVTFSKSVTGVNRADFRLTTTGEIHDASIASVSGSGTTYLVTVNKGSGEGTIRLDAMDDDSIIDAANNPLGGVGLGNGNFTSGEAYSTIINTTLLNSLLPTSRSIEVGNTATVFNTILNAGATTANNVTLSLANPPAGAFHYQQSDCATNALLGSVNPLLDIPPAEARCYVLFFNPSAEFAATDVHVVAEGLNAPATSLLSGVNTWTLRASALPGPDVIALTTATDFHQVSCRGTQPFAVAMFNVGAATSAVTVTADTGSSSLPLSILAQESDPATGTIIGDNILENVEFGQNRTVVVWVTFNGCISFDPAGHRIFIRLKDADNNLIGSTSTAVSTNR
jgi:hypothetical protein